MGGHSHLGGYLAAPTSSNGSRDLRERSTQPGSSYTSRKRHQTVPRYRFLGRSGDVSPSYLKWSKLSYSELKSRCLRSTRFGYDVPVAASLGSFKLYAVFNAKYFDPLLKGKPTRSMRSDPGINLGMRLLFGLLKKDQPFYDADTSGIAHSPIPGSNVKPENRINFLRHTATTKFFSVPNVRDMTSRFCGLLESQLDKRGDVGSDWVSVG